MLIFKALGIVNYVIVIAEQRLVLLPVIDTLEIMVLIADLQ